LNRLGIGKDERLEFFQSALILAEEFDDPLVRTLQCGLTTPDSVIDLWDGNTEIVDILQAVALRAIWRKS
jgi:hypothetical protein